MAIKLIVKNAKVIVKTIADYILNVTGIRDYNTSTSDVVNNKVDWTIQHYADTASNISTLNPVLLVGQLGIETDALSTSPKFKIGDGTTAWNSLPYFSSGGGGGSQSLAQVLAIGNNTGDINIVSVDGNSTLRLVGTQYQLTRTNGTTSSVIYITASDVTLEHNGSNYGSLAVDNGAVTAYHDVEVLLDAPIVTVSNDLEVVNHVNSEAVFTKGINGNGKLGLKHQSIDSTASGQETVIFAGSDGEPRYRNDGNGVSQFASQAWVNLQGFIKNVVTALGFTPENVANKSSSYTLSSTTTYPNTKALVDGLATKQDIVTGIYTSQVIQLTSSATPTVNTGTYNRTFVDITALAANVNLSTNLTGTPANGDVLWYEIKDNGTARTITAGSLFESKGETIPSTTVIGKRLNFACTWDSTTSKWGCIAVIQEI